MKGVYNITPTPFQPDGTLDEPSLITLTNFTIDKKVNGMTILGVLGEAGKVADVERERIISTVLQAADDEKWLFAYHLTFLSAVRLIRAVLPDMKTQRWGRIINFTSRS